MWQEIIVGICVLAASIFLVRHWLFSDKKSSSCGGCNNCEDKSPTHCSTNDRKTSPK